jgi:hypothetical protein
MVVHPPPRARPAAPDRPFLRVTLAELCNRATRRSFWPGSTLGFMAGRDGQSATTWRKNRTRLRWRVSLPIVGSAKDASVPRPARAPETPAQRWCTLDVSAGLEQQHFRRF